VDDGPFAKKGALANGMMVTVQGTASATNAFLRATSVQVSSGAGGVAKELGLIEGLVTSFNSSSDFKVGDQRIATHFNTDFVLHGQRLGPDLAIKVRGTFNASGVLVASRVEAQRQSSNVARGMVGSVSAASGTLTLLGVEMAITGTTIFDDRSNQHLRTFRLGDVRTGDYIEVRGSADSSSKRLTATFVTRDKPDMASRLQGLALQVSEPNLTVLGVSVMTNAQTRFIGVGRAPSRAAEFFKAMPNHVIEARGTGSGGIFVADEVRSVR